MMSLILTLGATSLVLFIMHMKTTNIKKSFKKFHNKKVLDGSFNTLKEKTNKSYNLYRFTEEDWELHRCSECNKKLYNSAFLVLCDDCRYVKPKNRKKLLIMDILSQFASIKPVNIINMKENPNHFPVLYIKPYDVFETINKIKNDYGIEEKNEKREGYEGIPRPRPS
jgi:hypothetical protein